MKTPTESLTWPLLFLPNFSSSFPRSSSSIYPSLGVSAFSHSPLSLHIFHTLHVEYLAASAECSAENKNMAEERQVKRNFFFSAHFHRCLVFTSDGRFYFPALLFIFNLIALYNVKRLLNQPREKHYSSLQHPPSSGFLLYRYLFVDVLCEYPLGCRACTRSG